MLDIQVIIEGDSAVLQGIDRFVTHYPGAVKEGLKEVVRGVHPIALDFLSGEGATGVYTSGKWAERDSMIPAGGYPVPRRTGHLARMEDFLDPGETKTSEGFTFSTGEFEAAIFNSAEYALTIHEGEDSSAGHGKRPFQTDALEEFDKGNNIAKTMDENIQKQINRDIP